MTDVSVTVDHDSSEAPLCVTVEGGLSLSGDVYHVFLFVLKHLVLSQLAP